MQQYTNNITSVSAQSTENTPEYKLICLTNGMSAKVSPQDYEQLSKYNWYFQNTNGYAARNHSLQHLPKYVSPSGATKFQQKTVLMHRMVMNMNNFEGRLFVDHINGDKLDNRRENLRIVNASQNHWNSNNKLNKRNTSGYRGIYNTKNGTFVASLRVNKQHYRIGTFKTLEQALEAYNAKKQQLISL